MTWSFPGGSLVKNPPARAGDTGDVGLIPGLGRSLGGGNGNPLQYFCLENPMDRGALWVPVHSVAKSWPWLVTWDARRNNWVFPRGTMVKNSPANAGGARDASSIPRPGRSPGEGNGNPLQYSCLENPMDRGAWGATVPGVAKIWTRLSDWAHTHMT